MRRVVITGLGMVTPLGWGVEHSWKALLAGQSGANRITAFDTTDYACQIACEVPRVDGRGGGGPDVAGSFDPNKGMSIIRSSARSIRSSSMASMRLIRRSGMRAGRRDELKAKANGPG